MKRRTFLKNSLSILTAGLAVNAGLISTKALAEEPKELYRIFRCQPEHGKYAIIFDRFNDQTIYNYIDNYKVTTLELTYAYMSKSELESVINEKVNDNNYHEIVLVTDKNIDKYKIIKYI